MLREARFGLTLFVLCLSAIAQDNGDEAIGIVKTVAKRIGECPRREVVAQFKKEWVKEAWGPPTDVKIDVQKTDSNSIMYQYKGIVEFSLATFYGPNRKTREEAVADTDLKPFPLPDGRNRNLYDISKDGAALSAREVRAASGEWIPRPAWPDACWDLIVSVAGAH